MEGKKKILVVEEDNLLRDVVSEKLEKNGYVVDRAQDGVVAMEKIRTGKPDLVLMDIVMPQKDGIQVLKEVDADPSLSDIPFIVISNSGEPEGIEQARSLGAKDFLVKSIFDPSEVLQKIASILGGGAGGWNRGVGEVSFGEDPRPVKISTYGTVASLASTPEEHAQDKKFVLVIEDDKFLRELLVRKLTADGFYVKNTIDASSAFAAIAERKPDLILLDLVLPGISGFHILERLKADPATANIPVVILSNLGQREDLDRAKKLGAKDFMVKANFTLDEIVANVRSIVG